MGTHCSDKSVCAYWRIFVKIFVSSKEFCRSNMSQKIKSDRICVTCYGNNIPLHRQRFSQKFSSTHKVICPCDVSLRRVTMTATTNCTRPTCTHGVICCCRLVAASCLNSLIDKLIHVSIINPTSHSVTIKTTYMYKALHYGLSDWPTNCPIQWQSHYLDMSDPDQCIIEIHSLSGNCKKWSSNKYMTLSWSLIVR